MPFIILFVTLFFLGWFLGGKLFWNIPSKPIIKIDDKNWMFGNELISFDEDTEYLKLQQKQEDTKHYNEYESKKLLRDSARLAKEYFQTLRAINEYPNLKDCVTDETLDEITEAYEQYIKKCDKLNENFRLTKEEFLIKEKNPVYCVDLRDIGMKWGDGGLYYIYNQKTAKYANGNMDKMLEAEFKEKWY